MNSSLFYLYIKHLGERFYTHNISMNCDRNVTKKKIKFQKQKYLILNFHKKNNSCIKK